MFKGSTIFQFFDEKKIVRDWIIENYTYKGIITQLLYKATRDGDKASDFHSKCDNMGPSLVVIQTTTGYIFGGYTSKSWTNSNFSWPGDNQAFVFSMNLKRKFSIKTQKEAIGHYFNKGPVFGYGHCIDISSKCLHNSDSYHSSSDSYEGINQLKLTNQRDFTVADYEVFQITFQ